MTGVSWPSAFHAPCSLGLKTCTLSLWRAGMPEQPKDPADRQAVRWRTPSSSHGNFGHGQHGKPNHISNTLRLKQVQVGTMASQIRPDHDLWWTRARPTSSPTWLSRPSTDRSCTLPTHWSESARGETPWRRLRNLPQRGSSCRRIADLRHGDVRQGNCRRFLWLQPPSDRTQLLGGLASASAWHKDGHGASGLPGTEGRSRLFPC